MNSNQLFSKLKAKVFVADMSAGNLPPYEQLSKLVEANKFTIYSTLRKIYIDSIGHVLYTKETISTLKSLLQGKKVIDVGAGTGFLTSCLKYVVNIKAIDIKLSKHRHCVIHKVNALEYINNNSYDAILLVWPPYDSDFAYDVINIMRPGTLLIYQGEWLGGCTANFKFFAKLKTNFDMDTQSTHALNCKHVQFPGINDFWYVFKKERDDVIVNSETE